MQVRKDEKSGLLNLVFNLPLNSCIGLVVISLITFVVGILDTVALGMVIPVVEILLVEGDDLPNNGYIRWLEGIFDTIHVSLTLTSAFITIACAMAARSLGLMMQFWMASRYTALFEAHLKSNVFDKIMGVKWPFFYNQSDGDLISVIAMEARRAGLAYSGLAQTIAAALNVATYLIIAFMVSWKLTFGVVVASTVLLLALGFLVRNARRIGKKLGDANSRLITSTSEAFRSMKAIRSSNSEGPMQDSVDLVFQDVAQADTSLGLNTGLLHALSELAFVLLLIGGLLLTTLFLNVQTSALVLFTLIFFRMYQRLKTLQASVQAMSANISGLDSVHRVVASAQNYAEPQGGETFSNLQDGIEFENVSFAYPDGLQVLNSVSISIPRGSIVALVGASGAGKTTIVDLTVGLLVPTSGKVLLDGRDLELYSRKSWRAAVSYVTQETLLFHDTIFNNIQWASSVATSVEVFRAAGAAEADDFIRDLSDGYDTVVGERGMLLSGGQRQRIALSRALIRDPDFLILDEATNEIDSATEAKIHKSISLERGRRAVLMITHRLESLGYCDLIHFLEEGHVVESGSLEELLASGGRFYQYYNQSRSP